MKVSGSYTSVLQGVSEQIPQARSAGRCTEQINLLPDPVRGLARRAGTVLEAESPTSLNPAAFADMVKDTDTWRTFEYTNGGGDYVLMIRRGTKPVGSPLPPLIVYDKSSKSFLPVSYDSTDPLVSSLINNGASAVTAIGRFVYMAATGTACTGSTTPLWASPSNAGMAAVWIRGGAHGRKFSITVVKTDGTDLTADFTTPTASYPGTLDTSGIPVFVRDPAGGTQVDSEGAFIASDGTHKLYWGLWQPTGVTATKGTAPLSNVYPSTTPAPGQFSHAPGSTVIIFPQAYAGSNDVTVQYTHTKVLTNPNYTAAVSEATSAYNNAVTGWVITAAQQISPEFIAGRLATLLASGGVAAVAVGGTVAVSGAAAVTGDDSGDGTLIRVVHNEVSAVEGLSTKHYVGKVVRVRPINSASSFYMQAVAAKAGATGFTQVKWVEGAGVRHTIDSALVMGTVAGSSFILGSNAGYLNSLFPGEYPDFSPSTCGDEDTSPQAFLVGRQITYLGVFQDRLLIGSGATLRCSKTADYLSFYRSTVLTVPASDPFEMLSQGTEDDTLRHGVLFDKDLVLFGDRRQYVVSGRITLSATNANMAVLAQHPNATGAPPLAVGGFIAYAQVGLRSSAVHQLQPSASGGESPESFNVSTQLDDYLAGGIIELTNIPKPTHLLARSTGNRQALFTLSYLDKAGEGRVQDAWHKLEWAAELGPIIGQARTTAGLLLFHLRLLRGQVYYVADALSFDADVSERPYLDSLRQWSAVLGGTGSVTQTTTGGWKIAYGAGTVRQFLGAPLGERADLLGQFGEEGMAWVGHSMGAHFTPTNPFVRDKEGNAITTGKLVVTKLLVSLNASSGFTASVKPSGGAAVVTDYNARLINDPSNIVGREVVVSNQQSVTIGKESKDYAVRLSAREWLPFNITAIEWVGQFFNRPQRI